MALIFLGVLILLRFQVSSFSKSDCLDFTANDEWPQFIWPQSTGLSVCMYVCMYVRTFMFAKNLIA